MQQRARVLAVAQSADLGGAELALLRLARRLPAHGFDVEIAINPRAKEGSPLADAARAAGIPVHSLPLGGLSAGAWPRALLSWPRARSLARDFDVVLLNGIVTQRVALAMTDATLVPYVHELSDSAPRAWRSARFWRSAPIVLAACDAVAQRCRSFGAPPDRLRTVYAPVERAEPAPRPAWADGPVVGYVGRIDEAKGTLDLIEAMRRVPKGRLVMAGDGNGGYAQIVSRAADALGDRAVMLGRVDDARALLLWFDVLAVPSRREAFGTVAAEALAAGTPVVATRSGGMEEYVVPGRNGDLVPPGDPDALGHAIESLLPRAQAMADAARADAARFDAELVAAAVADALREALARRGLAA
jgi:glycosyltransferase involved in cell wall biosynthesis